MDKYKFSNVLAIIKYIVKLAAVYILQFIVNILSLTPVFYLLLIPFVYLSENQKIPESVILGGYIAFGILTAGFCILLITIFLLSGIDVNKTSLYKERKQPIINGYYVLIEYLCLCVFKIERECLAYLRRSYFKSDYKDFMGNVIVANNHVIVSLQNNTKNIKIEKINSDDKFSTNLYSYHSNNSIHHDVLNMVLSIFSHLTTYELIERLLKQNGVKIVYQPKPEQSEIKTPINSAPENTSNASSLSSERNIDL